MNRIGQGIAIAGLALAAAWLDMSGKSAAGFSLWFILVLWIMFGNWG